MTKEKETEKSTESVPRDFLYDKRVVNRNVLKKLVTEQEVKKYLSGLKDESQNCEPLDLEEEE